MNYSKIGTIEGIFLICIGILNQSILYLPQTIFNVCGHSSIINVIYISIIFLAFLILFMKWYKPFHGQDILDISHYLGGNILKIITGILFIIFYLIMTSIMLRTFASGIKEAYFSNIDLKLILFTFAIIVFISHKFGKNSIIRCNTVTTFLTIISLIVLIFSIAPNIVVERMFPILGNGINSTFIEGIGNIYAFSGVCMIFFISPMIKDPKSMNKIIIISYCIVALGLLIIVSTLLLGLGFLLHVNEISPIYLLINSIQYGKFIQNPESLFILIWVLSIISFLCVFTMLIITITQKVLNLKDYKILSGIVTNLIFILALIPKHSADILFVSSKLYKFFQISVVFLYSTSILGIAYYKKKHANSKQLEEVKNE